MIATFPLRVCTPQRRTPLAMNVIVRDRAGLSPEIVERAKRVAAGVYRRIGVDIAWFGAGRSVRQVPTDSAAKEEFCLSVIQINLLPPDFEETLYPEIRSSTVGMAAQGSRFVRVLVQRIRERAVRERIDVGRVLAMSSLMRSGICCCHPILIPRKGR